MSVSGVKTVTTKSGLNATTRIKDGKALIKIGSHRARNKLKQLLGYLPQSYFSYDKKGEWREVTPKELELIKKEDIAGITQSSWSDDLIGTFNWS